MTQKIKKFCSIVLVLSMLFCSSTYAAASPFPDIAGHWAEGIINTLVERGVINGFPDGTAKPDNTVTRGEFTALLVRYLKLDTITAEKESPTFDDIDGHWSEKNVEVLVDSSILDPEDYDGNLLPNDPITRIEIIRMMVRAIGKSEEAKQSAANTSFKDDNVINASDKGYVILATKYGLITGYPDNTIRPVGRSTRAEAFALLLRQEEALEKIKKELEEKETEKEQPSGNSGGGSTSYPKAQVTFVLPVTAHTDTSVTVTPVLKYTKALTWSLTRETVDGSAQTLDLTEAVTGSLNKEGGTIVFKESGSYTLTATATNYNGKTTSCSHSITVYPVVGIAFELPQHTHTDKTVSIEAATAGLGNLDLVWSATKDGEAVAWDTAVDGILTNEGGTITFKEKGIYDITATVTDDTGRSFSHSSSITVYPVVSVDFDLPEKAHTDTIIDLITTLSEMEGLTIDWSLTRNGESTAISDCIEGELTNAGGTIRFKEKGVYALTATVTDGTGRDFITTASTVIYPVGEAGFYLPEIIHTDTTVTVEGTFEEVADATVVWTLTKDGRTVALNDYIEGKLTNDGGSIRFTHKGEYILKAAFTDGADRTYSYTSEVTVYPVPKFTFNLPGTAHTDTVIPVATTTEDMDGLDVEWLMDNTYGFQDWATYVDGTLDNDGGTIRFKRAGVYELVARVTDATGRVFLFEYGNKTEVHPVLSIRFELPEATHTDRTIDLRTTGNIGVLPIEWSITKDGKTVSLENYVEGALNAQGGKIRFVEDSEYVLTAEMTDALNRTFSYSSTVVVYPIPEVEFTLPEAVHTDKTVDVTVTAVKLGDLNVAWSITRNDEAVNWQDFIDGTLTNEGGSIRFTSKGSYTLYATITDELGRSFEYTANTKVYPIPKAEFILPETTHTDKTVEVHTTLTEVGTLQVAWSSTKNGNTATLAECVEGALSKEGGTIRFRDKGEYVLKAAITDELGRSFEYTSGITVYPVPQAEFTLSETTYTDKAVDVAVTSAELGSLDIVWSMTKDGEAVKWQDYVDGSLTNEGGSIRLTDKGNYTLQASITDELGRSFEYTASTMVYPIPEAGFMLPETTYTDKAVDVAVAATELGNLDIVWSITRNGESANWEDCIDGILTNEGGSIQFKDKGAYVLKAAITDELGRSFEYASGTTVYPIPKAEFILPETTYTDKAVNVAVTLTELGSLDIVWSVTRNSEAASWGSCIDDNLTNEGGSIRFKDKGDYTLKASITDELGRSFEYTASTEVYPIPKAEFVLPATTHTDKSVEVHTTLLEIGGLQAVWSLTKNGNTAALAECVEGSLSNSGGTIRFKDKGAYVLKATITDALGRSFEYSGSIQVYPVPTVAFTLLEFAHTDTQITVSPVTQELGTLSIAWKISKDGGNPTAYSSYVTGTLTNAGGNITFKNKGSYLLTANVTDETGRVFSYAKTVSIRPVVQTVITLPQTAHIGTNVTVTTQNTELGSLNISWELKKDGNTVPFASYTTGTLTNSGGTLVFKTTGNYVLIAKVTDSVGRVFTSQSGINIYNNPPTKPVVTANVTRTVNNGKFLVTISTSSTDPDNDAITYEYTGKAADNYYSTGTHTVKVRAKDEHGAYSAWAEVTFNVANQAPSTPVITRTPDGNSVSPGTSVTITAVSTDPEGDAITYVWEGRPAQTSTYPLGKNTVRVKAVDAAGAESPWTAIVFFVADSTNGGGMTLTGPESVILEEGIEGATITEYTFTVPPVSGHSGSDYGRVRGYNKNTRQWDQLDYQTTRNGITFSRTLAPGIYTQLEFYYYTNHNCMYNKSNITYSVKYHFE